MNNLFKKHIKPSLSESKVKVLVYYKPKKLSSCFSLREKKADSVNHGLVYKFKCNADGCNATYIGYTMNTLTHRAKQHRYAPSKVFEHYAKEHQQKPTDILDSFEIMYKNSSVKSIRIAEALLIKENMPYINVKYNEMSSILKIFK